MIKELFDPVFVKDRQFYKKTLLIALPVTAQSMITIGINLADTVMVGQFGESALAGVSQANQFVNIFHFICMGIGMGAAVMTSQFYGKGDRDSLKKTVAIMLRIAIVLSLVFGAVAGFFPEQILSLYAKEPATIANGVRYLRIIALTYPLMALSLTSTNLLRSVSISRVSLFASIGAFVLNVLGNWILMFGKLGMPRFEVAGAAIATLIARCFEALVIFGYLIAVDQRIGFRLRDLAMKAGDLVHKYIHYSLPVVISDLLLSLGNNAVAIVTGNIGAEFVSAVAVITVVMQLSNVFIQGISNASCVITGQTLGAGKTEEAYRQGVTFFAMSSLVGILAGGIIQLISPVVIGFYDISEQTKAIARELMAAVAFIVVFQSISSVMTKGVLRGGGDTRFLLVADVLFLWIASVPLGYLAAFVLELSPFWIYTALKIDMVIKSVWCISRMRSRKWIKTI